MDSKKIVVHKIIQKRFRIFTDVLNKNKIAGQKSAPDFKMVGAANITLIFMKDGL